MQDFEYYFKTTLKDFEFFFFKFKMTVKF